MTRAEKQIIYKAAEYLLQNNVLVLPPRLADRYVLFYGYSNLINNVEQSDHNNHRLTLLLLFAEAERDV